MTDERDRESLSSLTLYVNMMNDNYELAEMGGNPEFYTGWPVQ